MSKPTPEATKKLMNLLYSSATSQIASHKPIISDVATPTISRVLYDDSKPTAPLKDLAFDSGKGLGHRRRIPAEHALLSLWPPFRSNVLLFRCTNAYVTRYDMWKMMAAPEVRMYEFTMRPFEMVKRRDPVTLEFLDEYLLVFENQIQAAVYVKETEGKVINGVGLNLLFVKLNHGVMRTMGNQYMCDFDKIGDILGIKEDENAGVVDDAPFANYEPLLDWMNRKRLNYVIVRNWPFGLSTASVLRFLWDYGYDRMVQVESDIQTGKNVVLLKFDKAKDANRFIRNYHGKKWDLLQTKSNKTQREKTFYQPLLCEAI
ncbi:Protein PET54 [Candida viswanathii]|uniref:Protein PET54 n=1 Tax=Candida viswanathii TaxID=5486 RepID=A0A367XQD5_9ASCO|nr:Protein PET54 [Candida viswanathii]